MNRERDSHPDVGVSDQKKDDLGLATYDGGPWERLTRGGRWTSRKEAESPSKYLPSHAW